MKIINIGIIVFPNAQVLDITGPHEVFSSARWFQESAKSDFIYRVFLLGKDHSPCKMSSGITLVPDYTFDHCPFTLHTLIVPGSETILTSLKDQSIIDYLKKECDNVVRIVSICTGAFFLADIGLLNNKKVTTHWAYCSDLKKRYPKLIIDADSLFIKHEKIYTSAGVTAGMDLSLALVEEDAGKAIAMRVARKLVMFYKRTGGQNQFSEFIFAQSNNHFGDLIDWLIENLSSDISVEIMAQRENMSPRNFSRKFKREFNSTPAKFIEKLRLQHARILLENQSISLKAIAYACGFKSEEQMRRAFQRELCVNPTTYREHF